MEYIKGILTAVQLLKELVDGIKSLAAYIDKAKEDKWFQESAVVFSKLREAQTEEDRKNAAKDLARLWGSVSR